jgi:hypothetical protein
MVKTIESAKILFVFATIACGLSIFLPLSGVSLNFMNQDLGVDIYSWGAHSTLTGEWDLIYFIQTQDIAINIVSFLAFILFPITLICVSLGILAIWSMYKDKKSSVSLGAGSLLIVGLFFNIIYQLKIIDIINSQYDYTFFGVDIGGLKINWDIGFYLLIISIVLFFIGYCLQDKYFKLNR